MCIYVSLSLCLKIAPQLVTVNEKPQQTIHSPDRLYKAQTDYTKPPKDHTKPRKTIQRPIILNRTLTYYTRVANNINLTQNIKYPILKTQYIKSKGSIINKRVLVRAP